MLNGVLVMSNPPHERNIVLTGFMGTGKTTIGQIVADFIGWHFVDSDDEIVHRFGMSIPTIFDKHGEAGFRRYERIICQSLASGKEQVISTGGGMLIDPVNRELMMRNGLVICLTASLASLRKRLKNGKGRPLAKDWETLFQKRQDIYAQIPYQLDTTDLSPRKVAEKVVALWRNQ